MKDYQQLAIENIRIKTEARIEESRHYVQNMCNCFNVEVEDLIERVLQNCITINFHPDRVAYNSKTVLENLLEQGTYQSQFLTGISNGSMTAYVGGSRFNWEQRLFDSAYPEKSLDRPKYGALNILKYIDGATPRFGSCHFVLKNSVAERVTFSYGDSTHHPTTLSTKDTFICILAELLKDVQENKRLLNQVISYNQEALAILMNKNKTLKFMGRNLDYYIESHVHGDVYLHHDVEALYLDESFQKSQFNQIAKKLCQKYNISLYWIPQRQIKVDEIEEQFRGPMIPSLAKRIDSILGNNEGVMDAELLGRASRDIELNSTLWNDIGNKQELFQYIKQLWHTIACFG